MGNTIFNLLKIGELETDKNDKPLYNARIITTTVLANPFDDIEPRTTREEKLAIKDREAKEKLVRDKAGKSKGKQDLNLLSFGGDALPDASTFTKSKIKSSHDVLGESSGLSSKTAVIASSSVDATVKKRKAEVTGEDDDEEFERKMKEKVIKKVTGAEPAKKE